MDMRIVYLRGRDRDLNSTMSIKNGKVLFQLSNYAQVLAEPPAEIQRDESVYALAIPKDQVVELNETGTPILRVWSGPKNNRTYTQHKVQAEIYPIENPVVAFDPQEGGGLSAAERQELEQLRQSSDDLLAKYGELKARHEQLVAIADARDVSALKAFINEADLEVLEA